MPILTPGASRYMPVGLFKAGRLGVVSLVLETQAKEPKVARLFLQPPGGTEVALLEAIDKEAKMLRTVSHATLPVFDKIVEGDGGTWMLFEFVDGKPLSHYYDVEKSIPDAWILHWLQQLLIALDTLHTHDPPLAIGYIEPADVVFKGDKLFLSDIGILEDMFPEVAAQALHKSPFINFVAPEKRMSAQTTAAADLFSAAAIAFWLATGHAPVSTRPASAPRMQAALQDYRPQLPADVSKLIAEMLDFYPSQRPPSARAALERLEPYVLPMKGQVPPPPPQQEAFKAAAAATRIMGGDEEEEEDEFVPVRAPAPIFKDEPEESTKVAAWQEFAEDVGWSFARRPLTITGVVAAVVVIGLLFVRWITTPAVQPETALLTTLSGTTTRKMVGSWDRVREVQPGYVIAAGSDGAAMQFGHSILFLQPRTQFECQGKDKSALAIGLSSGDVRVETAADDALLVHVTDGPDVSVDGNSDVDTQMVDADCIVICKRGSASVTAHGDTQHLMPGNTARVPLAAGGQSPAPIQTSVAPPAETPSPAESASPSAAPESASPVESSSPSAEPTAVQGG